MIVVKSAQEDAQFPLPTETMDFVDVKISVWKMLTDGDVPGVTKVKEIRRREDIEHNILEIKGGF
jgi:hypothetical protein